MFLGDDVDDSGYRIRAIEGARRTLHDFYLVDVVRIDERQVVLAAHVAMDALAVNQDQDIAVAQATQLHLRAHVVFAKGKRSREATQDVLNALA